MKLVNTLSATLMLSTLMVILLISYPVNSESTAKIYDIEYPDKVYSGESAKLIFTIFNPSLDDPVTNHPRFFFRIELDGVLVEDELSRSWECPKGQSVERVIVLSSPIYNDIGSAGIAVERANVISDTINKIGIISRSRLSRYPRSLKVN